MDKKNPSIRLSRLSFVAAIGLCAPACASASSIRPPPGPIQALPAVTDARSAQPAAVATTAPFLFSYDSLKATDFYRFFNLTEEAAAALPRGQRVVELKPGAFRDSIDIALNLDAAGNIWGAHLGLARGWIGDAAHLNPFAKDIAASFLSTFLGSRDQPHVNDFADALRAAHGTSDILVSFENSPTSLAPHSAEAEEIVRTFKGLAPCFRETIHDADLTVRNEVGSSQFLHLVVTAGSRSVADGGATTAQQTDAAVPPALAARKK